MQVFDKTLQIKQMNVLEALDLLIARTDKVFAEVLLTQALGKTWFLLSHWELPNLVASGEIHPEILQN